jgi:hypothetical protein
MIASRQSSVCLVKLLPTLSARIASARLVSSPYCKSCFVIRTAIGGLLAIASA